MLEETSFGVTHLGIENGEKKKVKDNIKRKLKRESVKENERFS